MWDGRGEVAVGKCHSLYCYQHKGQRQTPNLTWLLMARGLLAGVSALKQILANLGGEDKHRRTQMYGHGYTRETHIHVRTTAPILSLHF